MPSIIRLPLQVDLKLYEGDDFTFLLALKNGQGNPSDLTGATARAQIRTSVTSTEVLGEFEIVIGGTDGNVWVSLPAAVSDELPKTTVWDVELTGADGAITTLAGGTITLTPDVTK